MTRLTVPQALAAARTAGFTGDALVMAVAIAQRESGLNPAAVGDVNNPGPGCRSVGLMQINLCPNYNNAGVWYRENPDRLLDPTDNFRAAFEMSGGGTNWRPWSTYRAGIPAPELDAIRAQLGAADSAPSSTPGAAVHPASLGGQLDAIGGLFGALTDTATWLRLLWIVAGTGLGIYGVSLILADTGAGAALVGRTSRKATHHAKAVKADAAKAAKAAQADTAKAAKAAANPTTPKPTVEPTP